LAWALGVDPEGAWHSVALGVTVGGYVIGRLIEGLFLALWKTHVHNWRRIDSWSVNLGAGRPETSDARMDAKVPCGGASSSAG